jgi:hypothetical protein
MKSNAHSVTPLPWLGLVQKNVETLRFGVVQLVVHEGKVVQIDRTEKIRVEQQEPKRTASDSSLS